MNDLQEFNKARKKNYSLNGKALAEYYRIMGKIYPDINSSIMLNRLKRTGFVSAQPAWTDFDDEDENAVMKGTDGTMMLGSGTAFTLDRGYDDFEKIVLGAYGAGKRL